MSRVNFILVYSFRVVLTAGVPAKLIDSLLRSPVFKKLSSHIENFVDIYFIYIKKPVLNNVKSFILV